MEITANLIQFTDRLVVCSVTIGVGENKVTMYGSSLAAECDRYPELAQARALELARQIIREGIGPTSSQTASVTIQRDPVNAAPVVETAVDQPPVYEAPAVEMPVNNSPVNVKPIEELAIYGIQEYAVPAGTQPASEPPAYDASDVETPPNTPIAVETMLNEPASPAPAGPPPAAPEETSPAPLNIDWNY